MEQCLETFSKSLPLDKDNMWYCPKCAKHVCATKKTDIWQLPDTIIIQFKRFCLSGWGYSKIDAIVEYPDEIDFSPYVIGPQRGEKLRYRLYAVSEHFGGLGGGHYTAKSYIDHLGTWYSFNDSNAMETSMRSSHNPNAYLVFYQRIK